LQPVAQRPAIVLEARRPVATAPDESAGETAQLQSESAGRALQEIAESSIQLPGASAGLQSHPLPHACVSTTAFILETEYSVRKLDNSNVFEAFEIIHSLKLCPYL
jgi:hypothetical protein